MTRLVTPNFAPEDKAECVEIILKAVEAARQLHNAIYALEPVPGVYRDDVQVGVARAAWKERLSSIEALENELLEHAMRVTLSM